MEGEGEQIALGHVVADGGVLAEHLAGHVCAQLGAEQDAALFLRQHLHRPGHLAAGAHHDTAGVHLQGGQQALGPVAHHHHVPRGDGLLNLFRAAGANHNAALHRPARHVPYQNCPVQNVQDVLIAGLGSLQGVGVQAVHVGGGHVLYGNHPLQVLLLVHNAQRIQLLVPHGHPGPAQAGLPVHAGGLADIHVPDVGADVGIELGDGDLEIVQHKLSLPVQQPGPAGLAGPLRIEDVFQAAVGDGGTDRVCIRVSVADHLDRAWGGCLACHLSASFLPPGGRRIGISAIIPRPASFRKP